MGWASGSGLLCDIIRTIQKYNVPVGIRMKVYKEIIDHFEMHDCDTIDECLGIDEHFDDVYEDYYGLAP